MGRFLDDEPDLVYRIADRLALTSLLSFILGGFIGRLGDRVGYSTRIWMASGTFIQTLFTMAATIAIWKANVPSYAAFGNGPLWTTPLTFLGYGFMSASMGLQGVMAKRLNTQFSTSGWLSPFFFFKLATQVMRTSCTHFHMGRVNLRTQAIPPSPVGNRA